MNIETLVAQRATRLSELESEVSDPRFFEDSGRARTALRERSRLQQLAVDWAALEKARADLADNQALAKDDDPAMAELAQAEIPGLEQEIARLEQVVQYALLPPDPNEDRDAIMEIRAGTGGNEAALFAADLYRMYLRYADSIGLKVETLDSSEADLGGFREVVFKVTGDEVFRRLRYESGVHRVQRVPATEAQGRIHTSTATVAVLPEAEEVDVVIKPEELRIEVCRAGGPGGQGVNTTDSAVQILHIPTGLIVRCQDGRSQQKNKEKALGVLRSRLLEARQREEAEKYSAHRKSLIGSGGREEKIRTYNFPQNRVTDHRISLTLHNLDRVIEGELGPIIEALQKSDMDERLKEAGA
ncbi:MAG: peptide chain release factor 1 [Verrucomicrobia bacterium]|nr:peptide chain release factor 1 [Verrucomicrobiota bacterium]